MRQMLLPIRILLLVLFVAFLVGGVLILIGKGQKIVRHFIRVAGESGQLQVKRTGRAMGILFLLFAVLELLAFLFMRTVWVPVLCMAAAAAGCYMTLLQIDRRCRIRSAVVIDEEDKGDIMEDAMGEEIFEEEHHDKTES